MVGNPFPMVLACDIGGTKTVIGVFEKKDGRLRVNAIETWPSREASGLEAIIRRFMEQHPLPLSAVCMGIAGPVKDGQCKATNLPWVVSEQSIKDRFGWSRVRLINDLAATALAVPRLEDREVVLLKGKRWAMPGNIGIVAPGTGLGMALLIHDNGRYVPVASEGGHVDFSPRDERQAGLSKYLQQRFGHVSLERVVSGPGLVNIFSWLTDTGRYHAPEWLLRQLETMDPARAITEAARDRQEPLCMETLDVFVSVFGAAAGNLALTGTTTRGLYLGGGIPPKVLFKLRDRVFMDAFTDKGRFKDYLDQIPVGVILNERAALIGAAWAALDMIGEGCESKNSRES